MTPYLLINKINGYNERKKYLTLVPTDESKGSLKKYGELWKKIRDITRSITNNSHNYDDRHMEIKFNSDCDLPLKKALKLYELTIVVTSVFHEGHNTIQKFS